MNIYLSTNESEMSTELAIREWQVRKEYGIGRTGKDLMRLPNVESATGGERYQAEEEKQN